MQKIMIIEDDEIIREELKNFLLKYNYEVIDTDDFENIIEFVKDANADLILLDINLPLFDGYYICREIRKTLDVPIIVVTSRDSEMDELMSMNLGADDFIIKPYNTQILLARINAILKRTYGNNISSNTMTYKDLRLNLSNATITYKENTIDITKNEMKILSCLL